MVFCISGSGVVGWFLCLLLVDGGYVLCCGVLMNVLVMVVWGLILFCNIEFSVGWVMVGSVWLLGVML